MSPESLAALHARAMRIERAWTATSFRGLLATPHTHLTALQDGFALWRAIANEAELLTIAVDPAAQRQGRGTRLMHIWQDAAARVAHQAFLEVAVDNAPARALYAKCGFACIATRKNYYARGSGRVDALILRCDLPPDNATPTG
ncbi:MAG: GNAT family N-acetyltransferase [Pseudomonadota bacterium]